MVIFHSYVSLPEGKLWTCTRLCPELGPEGQDFALWYCLTCFFCWGFKSVYVLEWNLLHQLIKDTLCCHRHPHLSAAPEICQDSSWIHFVIRWASVKQKRTSGVEQHIDGTLHNYCINLQICCFCSHLWQIRSSSLKWGVSLIECARSHRVRHRGVVHWSGFVWK